MKQATLQKLIISIVLCYLQQNAMAQSKWQFGVYAGGNVSKLKPQELAEISILYLCFFMGSSLADTNRY
jgi:hypothetical protein